MPDPANYLANFLYVFVSIFVIVNPIQATLVFISLTAGTLKVVRDKMVLRATAIAFIIGVIFAVAGDPILRFFGITVDSLRVAGGIFLFLVALDMIRGGRDHSRKVTDAELKDATVREDISVFPLATPLLTGPGTMTTVVVQMEAATSISAKVLVLLAIVVTFAISYFILRSSDYIDRVLGVTGILVLTRIQGLILGAIAANFIIMGIWNTYRSLVPT